MCQCVYTLHVWASIFSLRGRHNSLIFSDCLLYTPAEVGSYKYSYRIVVHETKSRKGTGNYCPTARTFEPWLQSACVRLYAFKAALYKNNCAEILLLDTGGCKALVCEFFLATLHCGKSRKYICGVCWFASSTWHLICVVCCIVNCHWSLYAVCWEAVEDCHDVGLLMCT